MSSPTVLWLLPDGAAGNSPLAERVALDHRVVTLAASSTDARAVAAVSPEVGAFVLIGQSSGAESAITLARDMGEACTALVLIAPVLTPPPSPQTAPDLPILLLLGTDDTRVPPSTAGALCAALPRAHPILIYGAGHALDHERLEAVAAVVLDFITRPDKFIVRNASDLIYP